MVMEFKYRMKHKSGQYRWFHTFGTIFDRNAEGKVEHVLNISIDITDRMEAEQKNPGTGIFYQAHCRCFADHTLPVPCKERVRSVH